MYRIPSGQKFLHLGYMMTTSKVEVKVVESRDDIDFDEEALVFGTLSQNGFRTNGFREEDEFCFAEKMIISYLEELAEDYVESSEEIPSSAILQGLPGYEFVMIPFMKLKQVS